MRCIKILVLSLGGILLFCTLALAVLLVTLDDNDYRWIVSQAAKRFAGLEVTTEGPFSVALSLEPYITASEIQITDISPPVHSATEIGRLEVKIALLPLISGTVFIRHLSVDDATVSIVRRKDARAGSFEPKKKSSDAFIPVFESVSLRNVQVTLADADIPDLARLVLRSCSLKAGVNGDRLCLEGDGALNSKEFEIEGQFGLLADMLTGNEPYPMDLSVNAKGLCLNVSGTIDDPMRGQGLNVRLSGEQAELQDTLSLFRKDLPKLGRLTFNALVSGDLGAPMVSSFDLKVSGGSQVEFTASGSMLDLRGKRESRIPFSGACSNKDLLRMFLPEEAPPVSIVNVEGTLRHRAGHYLFDDIRLHAAGDQGLRVTSSGSVAVSPEAKEGPILTLNLMTNVTAPQVGTAAPFLKKNHIAPLGPVKAKARVSGTNAFLSLDEIAIAAGKEDGVHVKCEGRVGRIPLSAGKRVSDVSIVSSIQANKAPAFASLLGISFPDLGPLDGAFRFVEEEGAYAFKDIELVIGSRESLWLKGLGSFNLDIEDGAASLGGLDVEVTASAPSLAAVPRAADLNLPDLKPMKLETHIIDPDGHLDILDIEAFKFEAGTGQDAFLRIQGQASGPSGGDERVLKALFKTTSKPWVMKMLRESAPENYVVEGKLSVAGTPKDMRIEALEVGTTGSKRLYLEAGGTVKEIEGTYEYEGHIASGASDISVLRSLFGIELPPFGTPLFEGQIRGSMKKASFEGRVRLGSSRFRTTLSHSLTKQRPRVTATVAAPTVYLADVGVYPEVPEDLPPENAPEAQSGDRLFSDKPLAFDRLKALDLSVRVAADNIVGKDFVLKNLNVDMLLKDGKLHIAPATVTYRNGSASIDFTIDTVGSKPKMALKVTAEDVDIGALSAYLHKAPSLRGQLNLVVDLQSAGKSAREMATALKGEFGVAVEKGKIKRDIELIGQDAVDFLAAMRASTKYSDLRCMALRFVFNEGIGESEIIYLETPDMYARGRAHIYLGTETMKMVLQPKPKKVLPGLTSAVTLVGPIDNPKVRKLPFQEAAKLYGEIAMPMVFLPARGLGYLWYLIRKDAPGESPCAGMRPENNNLDEAH